MHVQSYLFFEGRCEEALAFYQSAIGAQVEMKMRFSESPEPPDPAMCPPEKRDNIMHASFKVGDTTVLASDGMSSGAAQFAGFGLALYAKDPAEADKLFAALAAGGQVRMPLQKTFWSPAFGMVADRFGVVWMVMVDDR